MNRADRRKIFKQNRSKGITWEQINSALPKEKPYIKGKETLGTKILKAIK